MPTTGLKYKGHEDEDEDDDGDDFVLLTTSNATMMTKLSPWLPFHSSQNPVELFIRNSKLIPML